MKSCMIIVLILFKNKKRRRLGGDYNGFPISFIKVQDFHGQNRIDFVYISTARSTVNDCENYYFVQDILYASIYI